MCCALKQTQWRFLEYSWLRFFPSCNLILAIFLTFHFEKEMYHKPATPANSFFFCFVVWKIDVSQSRDHTATPLPVRWFVTYLFFKVQNKTHFTAPPSRLSSRGSRVLVQFLPEFEKHDNKVVDFNYFIRTLTSLQRLKFKEFLLPPSSQLTS